MTHLGLKYTYPHTVLSNPFEYLALCVTVRELLDPLGILWLEVTQKQKQLRLDTYQYIFFI